MCEKWYHVDCTDVVSPNDYINKPYTCKECPEKDRKKTKKPKDSTRGKGKVGRPKRRQRSRPIQSYLTKEDWKAGRDWLAKNIEIKLKNKRNINEVGSPDKTETILEDKKRKKEEGTEKKGDEKKVDEEVTHSSPLKDKLCGIINYVSGEIENGKKQGEKEEEQKEKENGKQAENRVTNDEGVEEKADKKRGKKREKMIRKSEI